MRMKLGLTSSDSQDPAGVESDPIVGELDDGPRVFVDAVCVFGSDGQAGKSEYLPATAVKLRDWCQP